MYGYETWRVYRNSQYTYVYVHIICNGVHIFLPSKEMLLNHNTFHTWKCYVYSYVRMYVTTYSTHTLLKVYVHTL